MMLRFLTSLIFMAGASFTYGSGVVPPGRVKLSTADQACLSLMGASAGRYREQLTPVERFYLERDVYAARFTHGVNVTTQQSFELLEIKNNTTGKWMEIYFVNSKRVNEIPHRFSVWKSAWKLGSGVNYVRMADGRLGEVEPLGVRTVLVTWHNP